MTNSMYPPQEVGNHNPRHWAGVAVGFLVQQVARPESGVWLKAAVDLDIRVLAWVRSLTNIQAVHPETSSTWQPMWQPDRLSPLQHQLDRTLAVLREHLDPAAEDIDMTERRQMLLDTVFHILRSLLVGLSPSEAAKVLEAWLVRRQRSPLKFYYLLMNVIHARIQALDKEEV